MVSLLIALFVAATAVLNDRREQFGRFGGFKGNRLYMGTNGMDGYVICWINYLLFLLFCWTLLMRFYIWNRCLWSARTVPPCWGYPYIFTPLVLFLDFPPLFVANFVTLNVLHSIGTHQAPFGLIEQTVGIHVRADVLSRDLLSVCKQVGHIYKLIVPLYYIECHLFGSLFGRDTLRLLILYEATSRLKETIRRFAIIS